jgi:hypothetical protein
MSESSDSSLSTVLATVDLRASWALECFSALASRGFREGNTRVLVAEFSYLSVDTIARRLDFFVGSRAFTSRSGRIS